MVLDNSPPFEQIAVVVVSYGVSGLFVAPFEKVAGATGSRGRPPIEFLLIVITVALCRASPATLFWHLPFWQMPSLLALSPLSSMPPYPP
jgi:hypothetical protein